MAKRTKFKSSVKKIEEAGPIFDKALADFVSQRGSEVLSKQLINDLRISFVEAIANASKHADELAKNGHIDFLINFKPRSIVMEIIDHGPGFELKKIPLPKFDALDESGRGVFIIRQLMDEVSYVRGPARNKLVLKRNLPYFNRNEEGLDLLHELSHTLFQSGEDDGKSVYRLVLKQIVEAFGVERASLMLFDPVKKRLGIVASVGMAKQVGETVALKPGEGIAGFVFRHAKPCVVANIEKSADGWEKKSGYKSLSLMCAPFFDPQSLQQPLGVINVTERSSGRPFGKKDLRLLTTIANQFTAYLYVNRLKKTIEGTDILRREIEIARHIQQSFLPATPIEINGMKLCSWLENASSMGGDLFDIVERDKGCVYIVLADVSGHNVAAAMSLVNCRGHLRALLLNENDPAKVLTQLNNLIFEDLNNSGQFISLLLLKFNLPNRKLVIANAGHDAPWVFEKNKAYSLEHKIPSGILLGLQDRVNYESCEITLEKHSSLLLFTDGLPELRNPKGELLGRKSFYQFLKGLSGNAVELMAAIKKMVDAYQKKAPFKDDLTVLTLDL